MTNSMHATRADIWHTINHLIATRSLPVPHSVNLNDRIWSVDLTFDEQGMTDRWAASLGITDGYEVNGDTWYTRYWTDSDDRWTWHIQCIPWLTPAPVTS